MREFSIGLCLLAVCLLAAYFWFQRSRHTNINEYEGPVLRLLTHIESHDQNEGVEVGKAVKLLGLNDFTGWIDVTHAQKLPLELAHVWENSRVFSPDFVATHETITLYVSVREINGKQVCYQFVFCDYPIVDAYLSIRFAPDEL